MKILNTTLACVLGLALAACVSEAKSDTETSPAKTPAAKKVDTPAPKSDAPAAKPADAAAALTTTALELSKIP